MEFLSTAWGWVSGAATSGWSLIPSALGAVWAFFNKWFVYAAVWWAAKQRAKAQQRKENLDAIKDTVKAVERVQHDTDYADKLRNRSRGE